MSYDPSKIMYVCDRCNSYPCSCRFTHKPLEVIKITCNDCDFVSLGMLEMSNHHLDNHEKAVPIKANLISVHENGMDKST